MEEYDQSNFRLFIFAVVNNPFYSCAFAADQRTVIVISRTHLFGQVHHFYTGQRNNSLIVSVVNVTRANGEMKEMKIFLYQLSWLI